MKKFILGALTAAMLASPIAIAPASAAPQRNDRSYNDRDDNRARNDHQYQANRYDKKPAPRYRQWSRGQKFDRRYAQNYRAIPNWQKYRSNRLYQPPRGYHWVRSGNDAVLVAVTGGLIAAVLAGAFN